MTRPGFTVSPEPPRTGRCSRAPPPANDRGRAVSALHAAGPASPGSLWLDV